MLSRIADVKEHDVSFLEKLASAAQRCTPQVEIDEALKIWMDVLKVKPTHVRALYHIGLIYYREKRDFRNAKLFMQRVLEAIETEMQQQQQLVVSDLDLSLVKSGEFFSPLLVL